MKKTIAWGEMFLLVCASLAFAYIVHESDSAFGSAIPVREESELVKILRAAFIGLFSYGLVSAADEGLWTCPQNTDGTLCQEYPAQVCNSVCGGTCFPGLRRDFADCALGTCIDPAQGTCLGSTPRAACTAQGGQWDSRAVTEIASCRPGCCVGADQALFRTEQQCNVLRSSLGIPFEFRPVTSELACLALAKPKEEGACVLNTQNEEGKYACVFTTRESCNSRGGTMYGGMLCSNPQLNTSCTRQARTSCMPGKDEVYWLDSCGNRENIYDINRVQSWNSGLVLAKNASCVLGSVVNPITHQASCGNCNYLGGSKCGTPTSKDAKPSIGNYVCRDLSCVDETGAKRKNGESWCSFESKIGVEGTGNALRSVDVPGSEHSRKVCLNGEVRTEPCGSARNGICVENRDEQIKFSSAACRANQWQLCVEANNAADGIDDPVAAAAAVKDACEEHTDCVLKGIDLTGGRGTFKFNVCTPRYPPGFDSQSDAGVENAKQLCGLATAECKYVTVKGLFGSGKKYNVVCNQPAGAEAMNNLCMSLGDCGASANVEGDVTTSGFKVKSNRGQPPALSTAYTNALKLLATPVRGQKVAPLSEGELTELFGLQNQVGDPQSSSGQGAQLQQLAMISGALGALAAYGAYSGWGSSVFVTSQTLPAGFVGPPAPIMLNAFVGAAAGALIGAAGVAYLLNALGISEGLPPAVTYALIAGGAFGGYALGGNLVSSSFASSTFGVGLTTGIIAIVVIIVIIAIFAFLGIGKKKETKITYQCLPWQPPIGGAKCGECGADGKPCTQYQCHSLGQACKYVANSAEGSCVNSAPNDVLAPFISPDASVLLSGYRYEQVSERGFILKSGASDGCVPRYTNIKVGISVNELSQCKFSNVHTDNYDSMPSYFHAPNGREENAFRRNHTLSFNIMGEELIDAEQQLDAEFDDEEGESALHLNELFAPDQSGNVNLYVRCIDVNGNGKTSAEYNINFCASQGPDRTAPAINGFIPATPAYSSYNATEQKVSFFTNEPAECKWDTQDSAYENMMQSASCANVAADATPSGWYCNATLPLSFAGTDQETFYFRCMDQPFANATDRNTNQQGTSYIVRKTLTPLRIVSVDPQNKDIVTNGLPAITDLKVTTGGGAPGTTRQCEFQFGDRYIPFFETGSDNHRQPNLRFFNVGAYNIPIRCTDSAGNSVTGNSQFNISVDSMGPRITRVYNNNGLVVVTNENARCAYSLSSCSFAFVNGTLMSGESRVHSSSLSGDSTQYVICRDRFENPSACVAVRKGGL